MLAGRDAVGIVRTGIRRTVAFMLPPLQRLSRTAGASRPPDVRALVLSPTGESSEKAHKAVLNDRQCEANKRDGRKAFGPQAVRGANRPACGVNETAFQHD